MKQEQQKQNVKKGNPLTGFLVGLLIVLFFNGLIVPLFSNKEIIMTDYGSFIAKVDSGTVEKVMIKNNQIYFTAIDGNKDIQTYQTGETNDPQLVNRLLNAKSPNEGERYFLHKSCRRRILRFLISF